MSVALRNGTTILAETAWELAPLIRSRVCGLSPEVRHLAGLHFGWWDDEGALLDAPPSTKSVRRNWAIRCWRSSSLAAKPPPTH